MGTQGGALTGAVTQAQGRVVVSQGVEVLSLHVHQGGPGEGHIVPDGRLDHGLMHQPVLGRHLLAHRGTEGAARSPAAWAPASAHPGAPPPPKSQ